MTVALSEIAGEQFSEQRRFHVGPRKRHRYKKKYTPDAYRKCATCGRQKRTHTRFKKLLWCPTSLRGVDDSTPIYLLTWRPP